MLFGQVSEMKKWWSVMSIVFIFLLGALAGALLTHGIYQQRIAGIFRGEPSSMQEVIVNKFSRDLHLESSQVGQFRAIVKETQEEVRKVRQQVKPQIEEILARSKNKVRAILSPVQREKFEKIIAERDRRRMRREGHH